MVLVLACCPPGGALGKDKVVVPAVNDFDRAFLELTELERAIGQVDVPEDDKKAGKDRKAAKAVPADLLTVIGGETGEAFTWVVERIELAREGVGLDLNGDGIPDNDLGNVRTTLPVLGEISLTDWVNEAIEDQLRQRDTDNVMAVTLWGRDGGPGKAVDRVLVAFGQARDRNGDFSDNFTGTADFDMSGSLALDGRPFMRVPVSIDAAGGFELLRPAGVMDLRGLDHPLARPLLEAALEGEGPVAVRATALKERIEGISAFTITPRALVAALDAKIDEVIPGAFRETVKAALEKLLVPSIDTDHDKVADALAVVLEWRGLRATVKDDLDPMYSDPIPFTIPPRGCAMAHANPSLDDRVGYKVPPGPVGERWHDTSRDGSNHALGCSSNGKIAVATFVDNSALAGGGWQDMPIGQYPIIEDKDGKRVVVFSTFNNGIWGISTK